MKAREDEIITQVRRLVANHRLQYEGHAKHQMHDRRITYPEVEYVLRSSGIHRVERDRWNDLRNTMAYAIEGPTIDLRQLRIVVCIVQDHPIPEDLLLVITAIDIT